jgi:hypothetical protein
MQGQAGQQREGRAFLEFVLSTCPLLHLAEGMWRLIEQLKTDSIANGPVVEITTPPVHECWRYPGRIGDHRRDRRGLIIPRFP